MPPWGVMLELVRRAAKDDEEHRKEHEPGSACEHQRPRLILHPHQLRQLVHEIDGLPPAQCNECPSLLEHLRRYAARGWEDPLRRSGQVPWQTTLTLQELRQLISEIDALTLRED